MLQQILLPKQLTFYSKKVVCVFVFSILCLFPKTHAQIIYVDSSVAVSGDGSSWANAYKELRNALITLRTNTNILEIDVAKGTYKPTDDNNMDSAFCIYRDNIKIIGGYPSGGGSRNINANKVNLSGLSGGVYTSYHVIMVAGVFVGTDSIVLDGLTIINGVAINGSYSFKYNGQTIAGNTGSGLCLQGNSSDCRITVRNCTFAQNSGNRGAGIYSYSTGSLFVNNCSFDSNVGYGSLSAGVNSYGGGLYNYQTTANVSNCSFTNNSMNRSGTGIGIYNEQASITIANTSFAGNSGNADGGAIANVNNASADISYCIFTNNNVEDIYSSGHGCGIYNSASGINLYHSSFIGNKFSGDGTLYLSSSPVATINNVSFIQNSAIGFTTTGNSAGITSIASSPLISNCLFAMDTAIKGGAIYNGLGAYPIVSNCTFYRNFAETSGPSAGGAVHCADSSGGSYRNCIFWQDTVYVEYPPFGRYEFYSEYSGGNLLHPPPSISYSIIQSPLPVLNVLDSGNNSNDYPQFVDSANIAGADGLYGTGDDGLRLQVCSPGIDAGINNAIPAGVTKDLKGDDRIFNNTVDIGCYENLSPVVNNSTLIANNGDSVFKSVYGTVDLLKDCQLIASIVPSGASPISGGIKVKVTIDHTGTLLTHPYVQRFYDIEPSKNASIATATISLYFTQADFDAYNLVRGSYPSLPLNSSDAENYKSNIIVHQFHGNNGDGSEAIIVPSGVVWSSTNSWWVVSFEVTGFSRFYLNTSSIALPVVLEYFKGQKQGNNTYLTWKVDCSNSSLLIINLQKSSDGTAFSTLYSTNTSIQNCLHPFNYTDIVPQVIANYYRLQIIETTAKITYSNTLLFDNGLAGIIVSPGIIKQGQMLNITIPQGDFTIIIYNSIGETLKKERLLQGVNSITLTIPYGIYFYCIADKNQHIQKTGKIIVD